MNYVFIVPHVKDAERKRIEYIMEEAGAKKPPGTVFILRQSNQTIVEKIGEKLLSRGVPTESLAVYQLGSVQLNIAQIEKELFAEMAGPLEMVERMIGFVLAPFTDKESLAKPFAKEYQVQTGKKGFASITIDITDLEENKFQVKVKITGYEETVGFLFRKLEPDIKLLK